MDATLTAISFGLLAAISWGISDFLIGKSSKKAEPMKGALLVNAYGALIYGIVYVLLLHQHSTITHSGLAYAIAGGAFFGIAQASFFKAMNLGPIGLVSPISSVYPLVTLLASVVLFSEHVSVLQVLGIVLIVCGVVTASGVSSKRNSKTVNQGPFLALVPVLTWGIGWVFISRSISLMSWKTTLLIELVATTIVLVAVAPFIKGTETINLKEIKRIWPLTILWSAALIQMIGILAVNFGLNKAPNATAVVIAISTCYPALTIFLALHNLKERIPLVQLMGGIIGIVGVVILSVGS
jgi:drug/metabolite transporter (DMT)-like permease